MTEMKYIFPKQLQSVAVFAFIAVLIVLLLILTVMVHMRNKKLKSTLEEQMAERRLLDKICADFDRASEGTAFPEGAHYLSLQKQTESESA